VENKAVLVTSDGGVVLLAAMAQFLTGRASIFVLVVAKAQTFVYITGWEPIPSSKNYRSVEMVVKGGHCLGVLRDFIHILYSVNVREACCRMRQCF
jgi:hypothetical protein